MDQLVQCPVCTLFLHNGMSLESHLDTHPKDQVIKALCSLSTKSSNYGSRTSTPMHSERSYRSRSRTPATDENMRWNGSHRSAQDNDRYWRSRTPSRASKAPHSTSMSRIGTPDRIGDINFESSSFNSAPQFPGSQYAMKSDKMQQTYTDGPPIDIDQQYLYYNDQSDERELKYSRSADYAPIDSTNNALAYNLPLAAPKAKLQTTLVPRKHSDFVKILPKPNNMVMKANQYIGSGVKPLHVMMPTAPTFVQKNVHNNMILAGGVPATQIIDTKGVAPLVAPNQFNQMSSTTLTPGTTVVTQNSQIIFREMVHNLDGKPFLSTMPGVLGNQENISNVHQSSSLYQNVMVLDQFGNASCMYTPQPLLQKNCPNIYNDNTHLTTPPVNKSSGNILNDANKTLIIEVGPIINPTSSETSPTNPLLTAQPEPSTSVSVKSDQSLDKNEGKAEVTGTNKGLKILSNIKVEVPVQHHKNMLNTVMDLTGPNESDYPIRPITPEKILPDLDDNSTTDDCTQPSMASCDSQMNQTFSVIKNIGNPPSYKDSTSKSNFIIDNKVENELSDSCPVPDLICNEKPSISPCSELSEHGDNATDHIPVADSSSSLIYAHSLSGSKASHKPASPKPRVSKSNDSSPRCSSDARPAAAIPPKPFKNNPLILNNIYVKKNKKILQIKNAKTTASSSQTKTEPEPVPSSSKCRSPENFTMNKLNQKEKISTIETVNILHTVSIEKIRETVHENHHEFDADTEEQSMDIEPIAPSAVSSSNEFPTSLVQIKEEINTSNEGYSNEAGTSSCNLAPLEGLRPINVISYGNMAGEVFEDDDSNHRELLELEATSKNKQFVNMMNDNYFGDNIYADYFTPDREEAFDAVRDSTSFGKDVPKDVWMKESEFVLPNFIHESYKIAESNVDYGDMDNGVQDVDVEKDTKADVLSESRSDGEPALNIRADERMPPRGELSGQESNGDMDSAWSGMYNEVTPAEPYDLIARESWVSDGSEVDAAEKREALNEDLPFPNRRYSCPLCAGKFPSLKELRAHKSHAHPPAAGSGAKTSYSRLVTARSIKKEEKTDDTIMQGNLLIPPDSKEAIAKSMLQVFDAAMAEAKPKLETLIKQEPKRRRKDYVCATCKEDQLTEAGFTAHLKLHPLECLTCGKCFQRRANLALHHKVHLGIRNYKCSVCGKAFLTRQKLSEHHNTHTGRAPVKCTLCDDTFRRYSNMVQHRDRAHLHKKPRARDFVCPCGAVLHSRAKLLWHRETHAERPKACPHCSDKFVHAASLTRHMRRSHNQYFVSTKWKGKMDNVPCPVCKQIYLRSNLRAHLLTHSGKKPYLCVICNKSFTTKWNLKLHRWTHMSRSSKPFKCSLCKGAFIRQTEFISHMNAHKSVRPYTCNYCGCQFIRKYNCQRHVREHEMAKKFVCKVPDCGKSFHRSYYLSEHMKVHSGARPFACNICGKTSSNKSNHNKHIKIHHAREPVATEA